jgi:hypothetical protein
VRSHASLGLNILDDVSADSGSADETCLNKIELFSAKQLALGEIVFGDLTVTFAIAGRF